MANQENEYIDFLRGVQRPKLHWVCEQLDLLGVPYNIKGLSFNGTVLQVPVSDLAKAWSVMVTVVGIMNLGGALTDDTVKVMDLVDNHPLFFSTVDIEDLPLTKAPLTSELKRVIDRVPAPEEPVPATTDVIETEQTVLSDLIAETDPIDVEATEVEDEDPLDTLMETLEDPTPVKRLAPADAGNTFVIDEMLAESDPTPEVDPFEEDADDDGLWDTDEENMTDEHPELDYLKADKSLEFEDVDFTAVSGTVRMYEVSSSNLSRIGARINQKEQTLCTFYAQFKGGATPYRYGPVPVDSYYEVLSEAVRASEGRPDASVGSLYHHLIKVEAEAGKIKCQQLTGGNWIEVPAKKDRIKAAKDRVAKKG